MKRCGHAWPTWRDHEVFMSRMECGENADLLLEFAAGRLDEEARMRLERHTEVCPACREFASGQRAVWEALDAWESAPVSPDFDRRLYGRIEREVSWWDRILGPFRIGRASCRERV